MTAADELLQEANQKLKDNDIAGAFDALLAAWRFSNRAAEIAELCEMLSSVALAALPAISEKKNADRLTKWTEAFRDHSPLGLGPLLHELDTLVQSAEHGTGGVQPRFVFPRADALSTLKDDPRIAPVMLRALEVIKGGSKWQKVMLRYFRSFESAGDPRSIAGLEELLANNAAKMKAEQGGLRTFALERGPEVLARLREQFPNGVPPTPDSMTSIIKEMHTRIKSIASSPEDSVGKLSATKAAAKHEVGDPASLLADVYSNPEDDSLRMVLADALTDRNDERGELIVLQVQRAAQGKSTKKTIAREKQILKAHMREYLGPLVSVVVLGTCVFERGFLSECEVQTNSRATAELHAHHVEWATVQKLHFRNHVIISPAMKALREVGPLDETTLEVLATKGHPTLERIELATDHFMDRGDMGDGALAFATTKLLPSLRSIRFRAGWDNYEASGLEWIWNGAPDLARPPWASQIREIEADFQNRNDATQWIDVLTTESGLEKVTIHLDDYTVGLLTRTTANPARFDLLLRCRYLTVKKVIDAPEYLVRMVTDGLGRFKNATHIDSVLIDTDDVRFQDNQRDQIRRAAEAVGIGVRDFHFPWRPNLILART